MNKQRRPDKGVRHAAAMLLLELAAVEVARAMLVKPTAKSVRYLALRIQQGALAAALGEANPSTNKENAT